MGYLFNMPLNTTPEYVTRREPGAYMGNAKTRHSLPNRNITCRRDAGRYNRGKWGSGSCDRKDIQIRGGELLESLSLPVLAHQDIIFICSFGRLRGVEQGVHVATHHARTSSRWQGRFLTLELQSTASPAAIGIEV